MAPKAANDEIHDSSSIVIFPDCNGVLSDLKSSKFGPVKPMTIPNIKAVKFTEIMNEILFLFIFSAAITFR
jgi:hypothetical protein